MKIVTWEEYLEPEIPHPPLDITIGVFDGVHLGHREILKNLHDHLTMDSQGVPRKIGVVTFRKNPKKTLRRNPYGAIMTQDQQMETLQELGVDYVVMVDFSPEFSRLSGHTFMSLLTDATSVGRVVIGEDFCCGHNRDLDAQGCRLLLRSKGTATEIVPPFMLDNAPVSSTRIRKAVAEGCFRKAEAMLGKPFSLDLINTPIQLIGDKLVYEQKELVQVLPPLGTYKGRVQGNGRSCNANITVAEGYLRITDCSMESVDTAIFLGKE